MDHPYRKYLLGVGVDDIPLPIALSQTEAWLREGGFHHIVTPGPEFLMTARNNPEFTSVLNQADLSIPDGFGLRIGYAFNGARFRNRIPGVMFIRHLLAQAARQHHRVYLLGALLPNVYENASEYITRNFPGIVVAGGLSGPEWPKSMTNDAAAIEHIRAAKPDILLVAFGSPKQDLWIANHRQELSGVTIAIGVGRTFDYFAGVISEAPAIFRRLGFEWLYTFLRPRNMFQSHLRRRRVWNATWHFLTTVITQ